MVEREQQNAESALRTPHFAFRNQKHSISVIIPALNEESQIGLALAALAAQPGLAEIIVVDGGSTDRTVELARAQDARVLEFGRASRALQMNAGAALAGGATLLFLHADVRLPAGVSTAINQALMDERVTGGCFQFRFPIDLPRAWHVYAWGISWRTRWFHSATGDQALFARRAVFEQLEGYRDIPLMEDIEFFQALKRQGRVVVLPQVVTVSPRRWQQFGLVRTGLLMYALRFGHWLGIAPERLKRFFLDVR